VWFRFGPYVQHKTLYAPLKPGGPGPTDVTLEEALVLIEAKVTKLKAKGREPYPDKKPQKGGRKAAGGRSGVISGYALFMREEREAIKLSVGVEQGGKKGSFMGAASQAWGRLGKEEQQGYNERARVVSAQQQQQQQEEEEGEGEGEGVGSDTAAGGGVSGRRSSSTGATAKRSSSSAKASSGRVSSSKKSAAVGVKGSSSVGSKGKDSTGSSSSSKKSSSSGHKRTKGESSKGKK
jgi:hypothetical protein